MISREHIETILKVNGVSTGSHDDHIRSILLSARYSKDEVDTAIMVLREDAKTKQTRVEGLHKVFRTGETLNSQEISQLLGIEVSIEDTIALRRRQRELSMTHYIIIGVLSVTLAVVGVLFYMYVHRVGVYYPGAYSPFH